MEEFNTLTTLTFKLKDVEERIQKEIVTFTLKAEDLQNLYKEKEQLLEQIERQKDKNNG